MNQKQGLIAEENRELNFEENLKYIDFKFFKSFIKKYYRYIILVTIVFAFFGFRRFQNSPKIYQGQFQIVVNDGNNNKIAPGGLNLKLFDSSTKDLNTQLVILKTPSVLLPAYEKIKSTRMKEGIDSESWSFKDFKNNLDVDDIDGTNVLEVRYKSEHKEIIPVALNKIRVLYEKYSFKDKTDKLEKTKTFLDNQINFYRNNLLEKNSEIEKFSSEYNLDYEVLDKKVSVNTQDTRNQIRNEIQDLDQKIISFNNIYNNDEEFLYSSSQLFTSKYLNDIKAIEERIIRNKAIFKDNDLSFKGLNLQKEVLLDKLKKETIGHLKATKLLKEATLKAVFRPIEIENKFRNMIRDYLLSEQLLTDLVLQEKTILLEASKEKDAWEVITEPKVINQPISPNLLKMLTYASVLGFFSSCVIFYFIENRKKIVYNINEIESKLSAPIILNLTSIKREKWLELLELSSKGVLKFKNDKNISLLTIGDMSTVSTEAFVSQFKKVFKNDLLITNNPLEATKNDLQFILASFGELNFDDLDDIQNKLNLMVNKITGIILISKNN